MPTPVRTARRARGPRSDGPTPPFSRVNGVALSLMLAVDVLFGVAWERSDLFARGGWWILALYAAGLTVAVAVIRPRPGRESRFGLCMSPLLLQIVVYAVFWGRAAGIWRWGRGHGPPDASQFLGSAFDTLAVMFFFVGFACALIVMPFTRRWAPLLFVEAAPLLLALGIGIFR